MIFPINNKKGFTLIETLVAVAILLVGVAVTFAVAQQGLSSTSDVRYRIASVFLAQEALEGVKNIKDSNLLQIAAAGDGGGKGGMHWLENITEGSSVPCSGADDVLCGYDIFGGSGNGAMVNCAEADDCRVKMYQSGGVDFYRQWPLGSDYTGFVRFLEIEEIVPNSEARVRVTITREDDEDFRFEIVSYLYNWF